MFTNSVTVTIYLAANAEAGKKSRRATIAATAKQASMFIEGTLTASSLATSLAPKFATRFGFERTEEAIAWISGLVAPALEGNRVNGVRVDIREAAVEVHSYLTASRRAAEEFAPEEYVEDIEAAEEEAYAEEAVRTLATAVEFDASHAIFAACFDVEEEAPVEAAALTVEAVEEVAPVEALTVEALTSAVREANAAVSATRGEKRMEALTVLRSLNREVARRREARLEAARFELTTAYVAPAVEALEEAALTVAISAALEVLAEADAAVDTHAANYDTSGTYFEVAKKRAVEARLTVEALEAEAARRREVEEAEAPEALTGDVEAVPALTGDVEAVEALTVEAEAVEALTGDVEAVQAVPALTGDVEAVEALTVEAEAVEALTGDVEAVEALTVEAEAVEALTGDVELIERIAKLEAALEDHLATCAGAGAYVSPVPQDKGDEKICGNASGSLNDAKEDAAWFAMVAGAYASPVLKNLGDEKICGKASSPRRVPAELLAEWADEVAERNAMHGPVNLPLQERLEAAEDAADYAACLAAAAKVESTKSDTAWKEYARRSNVVASIAGIIAQDEIDGTEAHHKARAMEALEEAEYVAARALELYYRAEIEEAPGTLAQRLSAGKPVTGDAVTEFDHSDHWSRVFTVADDSCPAAILEHAVAEWAEHDGDYISALIENQCTPTHLLAKAWGIAAATHNAGWGVRKAISEHPNATDELKSMLFPAARSLVNA